MPIITASIPTHVYVKNKTTIVTLVKSEGKLNVLNVYIYLLIIKLPLMLLNQFFILYLANVIVYFYIEICLSLAGHP